MSGEKPLPAAFEVTTTHPELRVFPAATKAGDWPAIAAGFQQLRGWQAASSAIWLIADVPGSDQFFRQVVAREPSPMAATILGYCLISAGWRIRTSYAASRVSREQFAALHDHLRDAERTLMDVTARDPRAMLAWKGRLTTAMGLSLGVAEGRRRYDRLARVVPDSYSAQSSHLQHTCPKWGGSWETAYAFARECVAQSPPGGLNGAVLATVFLEQWAVGGDDEPGRVLREGHQEVWAAAQRSVLHPGFRREPGWVGALNEFAAFFNIAGLHSYAAVFFRAMGEFASESWWDRLPGDGVENFYACRAESFSMAGGA
ncbi:hypothetical protein [Cryptosporangium arvum]|uniref:hypothetical protein n=1 Tax=Cryptosporangium arvum TaxID=80871 RepID=UPI0004AFAF0F|nr:hypothetical protein [Cryptosporangium arvum]